MQTFPKCTKCYDKGYSTEHKGNTIAHPDFMGDQPEYIIEKGDIVMNFCLCERGEALKHLIAKREYKLNIQFAEQLNHVLSQPKDKWEDILRYLFEIYTNKR